MERHDISSREEIILLLEKFYEKLLADPSINYFFTEIAAIDIKQHLPVIADFWEMVLLNHGIYHKNVMQIHMHLHEQSPISTEHFNTWLKYFIETTDSLFEGKVAELAKQRARSVATLMQIKFKTPG